MGVGAVSGVGLPNIEQEPLTNTAPLAEPDAPTVGDTGVAVTANKDGQYDLSKLSSFTQQDNISDTMGDTERCSCNSTTAALLAHGQAGLEQGITGLKREIQAHIDHAQNNDEKMAWAHQMGKLNGIEQKAKDNKLDTNDLNELSSVLYQTYSTNKGAGFMKTEDVIRMQKDVGLNPGSESTKAEGTIGTATVNGSSVSNVNLSATAAQVYPAAAQKLAQGAFSGLGKGEEATARVFNGSNPPGLPNHFVTIGKDKSGQPFVYDPLGKPDYVSGPAAVQKLAGMVPIGVPNGSAAPNGGVQGQLRPILPTIKHG